MEIKDGRIIVEENEKVSITGPFEIPIRESKSNIKQVDSPVKTKTAPTDQDIEGWIRNKLNGRIKDQLIDTTVKDLKGSIDALINKSISHINEKNKKPKPNNSIKIIDAPKPTNEVDDFKQIINNAIVELFIMNDIDVDMNMLKWNEDTIRVTADNLIAVSLPYTVSVKYEGSGIFNRISLTVSSDRIFGTVYPSLKTTKSTVGLLFIFSKEGTLKTIHISNPLDHILNGEICKFNNEILKDLFKLIGEKIEIARAKHDVTIKLSPIEGNGHA